MTTKATFHTDAIRHHLTALESEVEKLTSDLHGGIRTFGRHDFSGYKPQTIEACIAILNQHSNLPGPLRIVQNALEGALKHSPEGKAASATVLRNLIQKAQGGTA